MRLHNSFVGCEGIGPERERRLWECGVTTWDDVAVLDAPPEPLGSTLADRLDRYVTVAGDHLARNDARFFTSTLPDGEHWRLYPDFRDEACHLDIETTGLDADRHVVTCVSCHRAGETTTLVRGRDLTPDRLRRAIGDAPLVCTYNGGRFDLPFLADALGVAIDRPHLDLMGPCHRLGLTGGLKAAEQALGIDRPMDDVDGADAVRLWHAYRDGDEGALDDLIRYNRADTANLATLADRLVERLRGRVCGDVTGLDGGAHRSAVESVPAGGGG